MPTDKPSPDGLFSIKEINLRLEHLRVTLAWIYPSLLINPLAFSLIIEKEKNNDPALTIVESLTIPSGPIEKSAELDVIFIISLVLAISSTDAFISIKYFGLETIVQLENPTLKIERSVSKIHPPDYFYTFSL